MNKYQKKKRNMSKYRKMISDCFAKLDNRTNGGIDILDKDDIDNIIDSIYTISMLLEKRFPNVCGFRETTKKRLKDKGYSKEQVDDLMDMYTATYTVGFLTSSIVYSMGDDAFNE